MTQRTHWQSLTAAASPIEVADDGTWSGPITWTGTWSADGRQLAALDGEVPVRPLPLPVAVQWHLAQGHDGAEVGLMRLDEVWQDGDAIMGRGVIDMQDPRGPELARKIREKFMRFVSADVDDVEARDVPIGPDGDILDTETFDGTVPAGQLWTRWRIMGATLLAHPAFPNAHIDVDEAVAAPEPEAAPVPVEVELTAAAELAEDDESDGQEPVAAGLVIKAADTGRVLMLQRSLDDEDDPARGTWEFPGGGIETEEGEEPLHAALREWQEETGATLPEDLPIVAEWLSENGVYAGFVAVVPTEDTIDINLDHDGRSSTPTIPTATTSRSSPGGIRPSCPTCQLSAKRYAPPHGTSSPRPASPRSRTTARATTCPMVSWAVPSQRRRPGWTAGPRPPRGSRTRSCRDRSPSPWTTTGVSPGTSQRGTSPTAPTPGATSPRPAPAPDTPRSTPGRWRPLTAWSMSASSPWTPGTPASSSAGSRPRGTTTTPAPWPLLSAPVRTRTASGWPGPSCRG
ncbi:NUDIX domain-containing protein [Streptomyces sp. NPDC059853]|uniref:NUDIX hydrolase n=1 Tax=Streptomyces sp. NPDC059853 TaxID=3346973 RepID=UPI00366A1646